MTSDEHNAAESSGRRRRSIDAADKSKAVLRVLGGEDAVAVAHDVGVSIGRLEQWQAAFVSAGFEALQRRSAQHGKQPDRPRSTLKTIAPWFFLLITLAATIFVLVHFMYRDPGQ